MIRRCLMLLMILLTAMLLLNGCSGSPAGQNTITESAPANGIQPDMRIPEEAVNHNDITLFFRYGNEPYLAGEIRSLAFSPATGREKMIMTELLAGPGSHSYELDTLFPAGTRVTAATTNGRILFLTLSREILDALPDEPKDWQEDPFWRAEIPRRRKLAMQSIVATMTENCDVDRVQIMLEAVDGDHGSLRLPRSYFMEEDTAELTLPMERDESLILSPVRAMNVICELYRERNWERLYRYVAVKDDIAGTERPEYQDFVTAMEHCELMGQADPQGGYTDLNGNRAVFSVHVMTREANGSLRDDGVRVVKLLLEGNIWKITMNQLTGWTEE